MREFLRVSASASVSEVVERGRQALASGGWEEARVCFEEALAGAESAEAWEGLSWAAWWLEDGVRAIEARERAYALYKEAGDLRGAARVAIWLANDHIDFRGDEAVARGWFARCERILDGLEPSPEHGWLAALQGAMALEEGDTAAARRLGSQARGLGRAWKLTDLEMVGVATEGLALVSEGAVAQGMRCLDEATAAALGGEYEELQPVCWTCCNLIYACERVRDFDRAGQWCKKLEEFTERMRIQFVNGVCRAHYAAVLTWHGDWAEAEAVLLEARGSLAAIRPFWVPEATVRLAELRRREGRLDEAERLFAEAESHPLAVLGEAELCLDRGRVDGAIPLAERMLRQLPVENRTQRAAALELIVRAQAARGDAAAAADQLAELRGVVELVWTEPLRAALSFCEGVTASGASARASLEDAVTLFRAAGAPFETARARLELAGCLAELGERDAAVREAGAAREAFDELGAKHEAERARGLLERLGEAARAGGPLSPREREVLRLVSDGLTDREIAARLVLSQHTVHRHVSNILAKLDCSTRAAAVAKASRLGLL
jgi:LuxR family transcriptional regulator, maltose regulon positive regulatory protein